MDTYEKVLYSSVVALIFSMIIFAGLAMYYAHKENMLKLQLEYKSLERNETNNDNKSLERNKTSNDEMSEV